MACVRHRRAVCLLDINNNPLREEGLGTSLEPCAHTVHSLSLIFRTLVLERMSARVQLIKLTYVSKQGIE